VLLDSAQKKLSQYSDANANQIVAAINDIKEFDHLIWQEFCNTIALRDSIRKIPILSVLPEFKEYWNAKTD
jgi:hypothetical protein